MGTDDTKMFALLELQLKDLETRSYPEASLLAIYFQTPCEYHGPQNKINRKSKIAVKSSRANIQEHKYNNTFSFAFWVWSNCQHQKLRPSLLY